jgi:hypothetical protein
VHDRGGEPGTLAIKVLDAEGLDAFSMRNVAEELNDARLRREALC